MYVIQRTVSRRGAVHIDPVHHASPRSGVKNESPIEILMSDIRVEIFLEYGCRSNAPLIDALQTASAHVSLTITVFIRGKDSAEFLRRGIVISPATFIDGRLAFYGP